MFEGSLSRSMSTTEGVDSELVPSSLASFVAPILRVANEMEKDNPRVAYLCRFHAFDKAHTMDPTATGRGVWQFKTYMLDRLKKEEQQTKPQLANSDPKEIQKFYQNFYEKNIREGQYTKKPEEMAKIYQIATVLYDVLRTVVPATKVDAQLLSMDRSRFGTNYQLIIRILKAVVFLGFISIMIVLFVVCGLTISDIFAAFLAFLPTGWAFILIGQACRPCVKGIGFWDSIMELGRAYECLMGLVIFMPVFILSWFPFVSECQTRLLFNQAFSRGLQISMILRAGKNHKDKPKTT